jgi:hypothetical protein
MGAASRRQDKLIRDFGVPRDNYNGYGDDLTEAEQDHIAQGSKTQDGRIGGNHS